MFFRLFKSNHPLVFLYLLLYALLIKGSFFFLPHTYDYDVPGILANPLFKWLSSLEAGWQMVIHAFSILMVYSQAIAFNQFLIVDRIIQVQNYIPALLFLTLSSLHPEVLTLNPANLAYIFVIPVFYYVFQLPYIQDVAVEMMFYAGLSIGLVSLLYFPSSYLIFPLLIALAWLRGIYIREFITPLIGFLMPYFVGGVAMYVMGSLPEYWSMLAEVLPAFTGVFVPKADQLTIGFLVALLTFLGFIRAYRSARENILLYRKLLRVLSVFLITGLAYFLFIEEGPWLFGYLLLLPVSIFVSNLYDVEKTSVVLRWLFWLLVLLALFFQWQYYLETQGLTLKEWLGG